MQSDARFTLARPQVIQESFDDEVVIVDLDSGSYYSLGKTGADVWNLAVVGIPSDEIVSRIAQAYKTESSTVKQPIDTLLQQLQEENLLAPLAATGEFEYSNSTTPTLNSSDAIFQAPVFQKFTDMQELLLLDPIHEVDAAGWPNVKA